MGYLEVPFKEKDVAKGLGAKWDPQCKKWFVPPGANVVAFAKWALAGTCEFGMPEQRLSHSAHRGNGPVVAQLDEIALYTDGACKGNRNVAFKQCLAGWG